MFGFTHYFCFIYLLGKPLYSIYFMLRIVLSTLQILAVLILYNNPMRYYYNPHFIGRKIEELVTLDFSFSIILCY